MKVSKIKIKFKIKKLIKLVWKNNILCHKLSVLLPQETTENDLKNDNKIWANKVVKKEKDLAEDENLKIDLILFLFKENKEGDTVTGKTLDILYKLNQKYEKNHKNSQRRIIYWKNWWLMIQY